MKKNRRKQVGIFFSFLLLFPFLIKKSAFPQSQNSFFSAASSYKKELTDIQKYEYIAQHLGIPLGSLSLFSSLKKYGKKFLMKPLRRLMAFFVAYYAFITAKKGMKSAKQLGKKIEKNPLPYILMFYPSLIILVTLMNRIFSAKNTLLPVAKELFSFVKKEQLLPAGKFYAFLTEWPKHRDATPSEFILYFDSLYENLIQKKAPQIATRVGRVMVIQDVTSHQIMEALPSLIKKGYELSQKNKKKDATIEEKKEESKDVADDSKK